MMEHLNENVRKKKVGVKRDTATKLIEEFLQRVSISNEKPKTEIPHKIKKAILFGSYLSDKQKLGDIDIFLEMESKWDNLGEMYDFFEDKIPYQSWKGSMENPEKTTKRYLKNNSKSFSFHGIWELEQFLKRDSNFPHKEIFNIEK